MRCLIELIDLHKMAKNIYLFQLNGEVVLLFFITIIFRSMLLRKISQQSYFAFYKPKHRIFKFIWHLNNIFFSIAKYIACQHDSKRLRVRKSLSRNQIVFVFLSQNPMYFWFLSHNPMHSRGLSQTQCDILLYRKTQWCLCFYRKIRCILYFYRTTQCVVVFYRIIQCIFVFYHEIQCVFVFIRKIQCVFVFYRKI